jgi:hypothetical protein
MGLKLNAEASWRLTAEVLSRELKQAHRVLTEKGVRRHNEDGDELSMLERLRCLFLNHDEGDV